MASVGKHIRKLRLRRGLTQEELAQRLHVTRQAVSTWETGRSQPDLTTLQSIAQALEGDILELIYGAPPPQEGRKLRRRWMLLTALLCAMVAAAALLLFRLDANGTLGTWRYGLVYQFWSQNYGVSQEALPGQWSLELDLSDPESSLGKVLYEDETGCRITVERLEQRSDGRWLVTFRAQGSYSPSGGTLVSGCMEQRLEKDRYTLATTASLRTSIGTVTCPEGERYLQTSLSEKDGNTFGFYLFPVTLYDSDGFLYADELEDQEDCVTVTVTGLTRLTTWRQGTLYR